MCRLSGDPGRVHRLQVRCEIRLLWGGGEEGLAGSAPVSVHLRPERVSWVWAGLRDSIKMWRAGRVRSVAVGCAVALIQGYATASPTVVAHPGTDFPSSESFYPYAAKLWAQEGVAVVHYCVDENGRLSEEPTVERTSGDDDLDGAALVLAKAGDGHYVAASEAGKAIAGCATLKVKFELADDPRFPTLSHRAKQLTNQSRPQALSLQKEFQQVQHRPPDLESFIPGDPQQLMALRNFAASTSPIVKRYDAFLTGFTVKMDELGHSDDVSEAERTAFSKVWQQRRAVLIQIRAALLDASSILGTVSSLADYVENTRPPLWSSSGPNQPNVEQRAQIDELLMQGRAEVAELQARWTSMAGNAAKPGEVAQERQGSSLPPSAAGTHILLESVAGREYSAASMPNVGFPVQITTPQEILASCPYPQEANQRSEEGATRLRLHLDAAGVVSAASLERSSGYEDLDAAAIKCVTNVRFQPATQDGTPQTSVIRFGWTWKIDWGSSDPNKCDELKASADAQPHSPSSDPSSKPAAIICTCWEESGKAGKPQLVESTGSRRLDEGAIKLAEAGATSPRPPGHPGCFAYRTQFELKN